MQSLGYVLRRVVGTFLTFCLVVVATFALVHAAPSDPVAGLVPEGATTAQVQQVRHALGFDRPIGDQFLSYVGRLARGDLGRSTSTGLPVRTVIAQRIGPTLLLSGTALAISTVLGLLLGMVAARRPGGVIDLAVGTGSLIGFALPGFWLAQLAVILVALHLRLFPLLGYTNARNPPHGVHRLGDIAYHLMLPALVLATAEVALLTRITRNRVLKELDEDYVLMARAKGVSEDAIVSHHATRNIMLPTVTLIGTRVGFLLSGALVIERVFSWPGIGTAMADAVTTGDSALVLGVVLLVSGGVLGANLVMELAYPLIDPRVRSR